MHKDHWTAGRRSAYIAIGEVSMGGAERRGHLEILRGTEARLRKELQGVPAALVRRRPAPGKWSILEIVCHLRDMEREAYLGRYRRILREENPSLPDLDGDVLALERGYRRERLSDALREWAALRKECLALLDGLGEAEWSRTGVHETAGRLSMSEFLARQAVGNDQAHLGQIVDIKARAAVLARLAAGPRALGKAVEGVPRALAQRRAADGSWSITEIACHLRDVEQVFAERFSRMLFSDRPSFWMMDNDRVASRQRYAEADLSQVLRAFRQARAETLSLLGAAPSVGWRRTGRHPTGGEITLEALVTLLAEHDQRHIGRVRELAGSLSAREPVLR